MKYDFLERLANSKSPRFVSGAQIKRWMSAYGLTIAALAAKMDVTQVRVREVRAAGVKGQLRIIDWMDAITGQSFLTESA